MRQPRQLHLVRSVGALLFGVALASVQPSPAPDAAAGGGPRAASPFPAAGAAPAYAAPAYGHLPLYFIENPPGTGPDYTVLGRDTRIEFQPGGLTIALAGAAPGADRTAPLGGGATEGANGLRPADLFAPPAAGPAGESLSDVAQAGAGRPEHRLDLELVGADPAVRPVGIDPAPGVFSRFHGPPETWQTGLRMYHGLRYRDVWPGIDLVYAGTADRLKYTFVVHPGADPARIRLAYRGATRVGVNAAGELEIDTPVGTFRDDAPYVYQDAGGARVEVASAYATDGCGPAPVDGGTLTCTYGFRIGAYDRTRTLVVDPAVLLYAGFIGSRGVERGLGITVDRAGSAYVVGQSGSAAGTDAFIAKLTPDGTQVAYLAALGGDRGDAAFDVAVDPKGNAYMIGGTASDEASFPAFVGPDLTYSPGIRTVDGFIAKVNATGTGLLYAGFVGGTANDFMEGVAVDAQGQAYITGIAQSRPDQGFPVRVGPDLTHNGGYDAFVAKLKAVPGSSIAEENYVFSGYIGGAGDDIGVLEGGFLTSGHVAVDRTGSAYISGMTTSDEATFPDGDGFGDLVGPDRTHNGEYDAFVAKLKPDGSGLAYAGYIGGDDHELGFGMAVDRAGHAYLTGHAYSSEATFPDGDGFGDLGGPDRTHNGGVDAFVAKVAPDGARLDYAGYIGGALDDQGLGVALDSAGHLYVVGRAESDETTFPTAGGLDATHNSFEAGADAFVARLALDPTRPDVAANYDFIGYIGGDGEDGAYWLAVDAEDDVYVVGDTGSGEATFPDGQGLAVELPSFAPYYAGEQDAFVVKIDAPADVIDIATVAPPTAAPTEIPTQAPTLLPTATPTSPPPPTATAVPPTPMAAVPARVFLPLAASHGSIDGQDG